MDPNANLGTEATRTTEQYTTVVIDHGGAPGGDAGNPVKMAAGLPTVMDGGAHSDGHIDVYEGLRKKRFAQTDEAGLLNKIRKEWNQTTTTERKPLEPQSLPYPRTLVVRSQTSTGSTAYHLMPVWYMMIPTWLHYLPWATAFFAGFLYLALVTPTALEGSDSVPTMRAAKFFNTLAIACFLATFVITVWIKSQIDAFEKFRSSEFYDGTDTLRRVTLTALIENKGYIRTAAFLFIAGMFFWALTLILELYNVLGTAPDDREGGAIAAFVILTILFTLTTLATLLAGWAISKTGTYLLSMDKHVLTHA